jgi:hypothetical protein
MKCANPDCMSGFEAETHHIFPIKIGGKNDYWNFICLCSKCHRSFKLHSQWEENCTKLFFWKSYQELNLWGFYLDEQDEKYYEKLALLLRVNLLKNKNIL